jgi:hypothetical protein
VTIAIVGLLVALHYRFERTHLEWAGLTGTVIDKRLSFRENLPYGSSAGAVLIIDSPNRGRVEIQVPITIYGKTQFGDRVQGTEESITVVPRMSDR